MTMVLALGMSRPGLDDGRAQQHVDLAVAESAHHRREHALLHLPVRDLDARLGHELAQTIGDRLDAGNAVVQEEALPATRQLAGDHLADQRVLARGDVRLDRLSLLGRRLDHREIADPRKRHVQRARDRRRRQRQDVDRDTQLLEPLLLQHAETLLLVDDDEPEILELDVLLQQTMRADDDVDGAAAQPGERARDLVVADESRQLAHGDREGREALGERDEVLLAEHGRRHEHRHLTALDRGLESSANRELGLAETDVAADDAIHRARRLHVALDLLEHEHLVGRLLVRERAFELLLPRAVGRVRVTLRLLASRVEAEQLARDLLGALLDAAPGALPLTAAEPRQLRMRLGAADVAVDAVEVLRGDEEPVPVGVLEEHVLVHRAAVVGDRAHLDEPRDAVVAMDDEVAGRELRARTPDAPRRRWRRAATRAPTSTPRVRAPRASTERRRLMAPNSSASVYTCTEPSATANPWVRSADATTIAPGGSGVSAAVKSGASTVSAPCSAASSSTRCCWRETTSTQPRSSRSCSASRTKASKRPT